MFEERFIYQCAACLAAYPPRADVRLANRDARVHELNGCK